MSTSVGKLKSTLSTKCAWSGLGPWFVQKFTLILGYSLDRPRR